MRVMQVIIMAGGKGTRIATVNAEVPKPMIPIWGIPVLEYEINMLKKQGYTDITIVIGHLGNVIQDYFGNGIRWGVSIDYIEETVPLGTAGALYYLKKKLRNDFLLLNGDIIFDMEIDRLYHFHKICGGVVTIVTHPNDHPYDSGIVVTDQKGCVNDWLHKEQKHKWYRNRVNAGVHVISPRIFDDKYDFFPFARRVDLDRDILKLLIPERELYAYSSPEYIKDMGTPERLLQVSNDIKLGKVANKNLNKKQKAIFLDRDGTINRYVGFLRDIDDMELLPYVGEAIRKMNELGYLVIVVSNQPVIARGEVTEEGLLEIHNKMETLLGNEGAYVDAIYYCPHHPDKGYQNERTEFKIKCNCRKPKPGMLLKAAADFNIDLTKSWMVGDNKVDIFAGKRAGCRTVYLNSDEENYGQDYTVLSLKEFEERILENWKGK